MRDIINKIIYKESIYVSIGYILLWYSKIQNLFGYKKSTDNIPSNTVYCYLPDDEKNAMEEKCIYHIKPCPYWRGISKYKAACLYLGTTDNIVLWDQCKICGIKEGF